MWTSTRAIAEALDDTDSLASLRARYDLPTCVIQLNGTTDGPAPGSTPARLRQFVEHRWAGGIARTRAGGSSRAEAEQAAYAIAPLVGADAREITVGDSTAMNLFRALLAAAKLRPERHVLVLGRHTFAADRYLARSAAEFSGCELRLLDHVEDVAAALDERVAVVALSHTDLVSGALRDTAAITAEARRWGALTLWDLSHSAGALAVDLHDWEADLATGCGYKYLGGGPGAPAYTFVAQRHRAVLASRGPICGPAGVLDPLTTGFASTPGVLALPQLRAGLSILDGVAARDLEAKTTALVALFLRLVQDTDAGGGIEIVPAPGRRGAQVSLRHSHAGYLVRDLFARGVLADLVEPDILRFSFAPSWLRYVDVWDAAAALQDALEELQVDHATRA